MDAYVSVMDNTAPKTPVFRVGILPLPGFALMSYASTVEPFRAANLIAGEDLYDLAHFTVGGRTRSSGAASIGVEYGVGDAPPLDLLLVVAGGDPLAFDDPLTLNWLRRMARVTPVMGGVSGGPAVLARAGLLKGRRMTIHWEHAPALAEAFPGLMLEKSLYVMDRDRVTCGGGVAALDLVNALITRHHGPDFARRVSDWFLHTDIRPSGGPQRSGLAERIGTTSAPVYAAVAAMESHIADPLDLGQLSAIAGVTQRHLSRLFRDKLGATPMGYYRKLRLDTARQLLTQAPISLTEIALATGFANASHFSTAFTEAFGRPPSRLRGPLAKP